MANTDGYYFIVAQKTTIDPNTGIGSTDGFDGVLYYKNFKAGGKNDGETPDDTVQINPIYPHATEPPPAGDPATLTDGSEDNSKHNFE